MDVHSLQLDVDVRQHQLMKTSSKRVRLHCKADTPFLCTGLSTILQGPYISSEPHPSPRSPRGYLIDGVHLSAPIRILQSSQVYIHGSPYFDFGLSSHSMLAVADHLNLPVLGLVNCIFCAQCSLFPPKWSARLRALPVGMRAAQAIAEPSEGRYCIHKQGVGVGSVTSIVKSLSCRGKCEEAGCVDARA